MWPPTITNCECEQAGWCERHRCFKPEPLHLLCRRQQEYFQAWEEGRGPCFEIPGDATVADTASTESPNAANAIPPLWRRAVNFGQAAAQYAADGFQNVDDATFEQRLAICRECPSCDTTQLICREPQCGCFLNLKARWKSQQCPRNLWPQFEA